MNLHTIVSFGKLLLTSMQMKSRRMEYFSLTLLSKNNELLLTATITPNSDSSINKNVKLILVVESDTDK